MEWKDLLLELVELVKNASELAWVIGNRQVLVHAIQYCVWGGVVACVSVYLFRLARQFEDMEYVVFSSIVAWGTLFISLGLFLSAVGRFVNSNYYTIKLLIALAKGE